MGTVADGVSSLEHWEQKMVTWYLSVRSLRLDPLVVEWFWGLDASIGAAWEARYVLQVLGSSLETGRWRLTKRGQRRLRQLLVLKGLKEAT